MRNFFLMGVASCLVIGCAAVAEKPEMGVKIVAENEEERRIRIALRRDEEVSVGEDLVALAVGLQLPQIEIPHSLKREAELQLKRTPDNGVHVYNGHVCMTGSATSHGNFDYSQAGWKLSMKIDGAKSSSESEVVPARIFNFDTNKVMPVSGKTDLRICSKGKFPKVKKVLVTLMGAKSLKLATFEWSAPWPE